MYEDYDAYQVFDQRYKVHRDGGIIEDGIEVDEKIGRVVWAAKLQDASDNRWDRDEWFAILIVGTCLACVHYVPAGYSSYTYDPEVSRIVYYDYSWEQFKNLALTDEMRQNLGDFKYETIAVLFGSSNER